MIVNVKKLAVAVLAITVLIAGTALMWQGHSSEASRAAKDSKQSDNNVTGTPTNNQKLESLTGSTSFFAEYRMERERTRSKQVELLREIINNQATEAKAREAASLRLVQISQDMENEMKTENLVKSKGYKECVVILQNNNTMAVIQSSPLDSDQSDEVVQLISNVTGTAEEYINVIARK